MNTENAEAATPEVSRSSDLSEEMNEVARVCVYESLSVCVSE